MTRYSVNDQFVSQNGGRTTLRDTCSWSQNWGCIRTQGANEQIQMGTLRCTISDTYVYNRRTIFLLSECNTNGEE